MSATLGPPSGVLSAALLAALALTGCGPDEPTSSAPPSPVAPSPSRPSGPAAPVPPPAIPRPDEPTLGPYPRSQFFIEHDLFLATNEPRTVAAAQATFLRAADEVLGLVIQGKARAYAVTMVSYHHVVNDVIAGIPVAVTY